MQGFIFQELLKTFVVPAKASIQVLQFVHLQTKLGPSLSMEIPKRRRRGDRILRFLEHLIYLCREHRTENLQVIEMLPRRRFAYPDCIYNLK